MVFRALCWASCEGVGLIDADTQRCSENETSVVWLIIRTPGQMLSRPVLRDDKCCVKDDTSNNFIWISLTYGKKTTDLGGGAGDS